MERIKMDGAYIVKTDMSKEGYFTENTDGSLQKHKYGFIRKISDLINYGKTMELVYNYICFVAQDTNQIKMFKGNGGSELIDTLRNIKRKYNKFIKANGEEYFFISDNIIGYYDKKGRKCKIVISDDGMTLELECFSFYDNRKTNRKYDFHYFPSE